MYIHLVLTRPIGLISGISAFQSYISTLIIVEVSDLHDKAGAKCNYVLVRTLTALLFSRECSVILHSCKIIALFVWNLPQYVGYVTLLALDKNFAWILSSNHSLAFLQFLFMWRYCTLTIEHTSDYWIIWELLRKKM